MRRTRSHLVTFARLALLTAVTQLVACAETPPPPPASPPTAAVPPAAPVVTAPPPPMPPAMPPPADPVAATPESVNPGINARYKTPEGRQIAVQTFEEANRAQYQKPDEIIQNLGLKPGSVVADVGAGTGWFEPYLVKAVGARGRVIAEDIQQEFLDLLRDKAKKNRWRNVKVVLGSETDARLPAGCCEVVIVLDAYHHFEKPAPMLASLKKGLKPGGRLVLVDFYRRPNDIFSKFKIDFMKHIRLDLDGVIAELGDNGWKHLETRTFMPYQYFAVFSPK